MALMQSQINLLDIQKVDTENKVFVIGMSKTGTTSMETFLEKLGYRVCKGHWDKKDTNFLCACFHYGDEDEILNITKYYDGFADAPWGGTELYKKLVKMYPKAHFILTTRDTDTWYKSLLNMYFQFDENPKTTMETMRSFGSYGNYLFFRKIFGIDTLHNNEDEIKSYYEHYNQDVRSFFLNNDYNFIEIDITQDNFNPDVLMKFLYRKEQSIQMPHINSGNY